ncbi:transposase domain protein, partial [Bordetella pertussis H921]
MADSSLLSAGGQVHVFIGIDVSKAKLDCTLLTAEADKRKTKVVVNTAAGVQALLAWCAKHGAQPAQLHAILEPTGLY